MPRGGEHELLRGHARDGGFVQPKSLGDLAQHQRTHRHFAMLEEMPLPVDDRLGHAQDRVEALLHVLDQPFRLLQLAGELLQAGVAVAVQDVGVHAVDAQLRHGVRVERRDPQALDLAHHHVGQRYSASRRRKSSRPGRGLRLVIRLLHRRAARRRRSAAAFFSLKIVARGESIQVLRHDLRALPCDKACPPAALPVAAPGIRSGMRAPTPGRVQALQVLERDRQIFRARSPVPAAASARVRRGPAS